MLLDQVKADVQRAEDYDEAEVDEEDGDAEEEDRVAEVGDTPSGAVVLSGVGIVLDIENFGLDDGGFRGGRVAHKGRWCDVLSEG
jgi:hypothetical protein